MCNVVVGRWSGGRREVSVVFTNVRSFRESRNEAEAESVSFHDARDVFHIPGIIPFPWTTPGP